MFNVPDFRLVGSYKKLPNTGNNGDIVFVNGEPYVYVDERYNALDLGPPSNIYPQICSRCGAPVKGSRCEYCGTEYL